MSTHVHPMQSFDRTRQRMVVHEPEDVDERAMEAFLLHENHSGARMIYIDWIGKPDIESSVFFPPVWPSVDNTNLPPLLCIFVTNKDDTFTDQQGNVYKTMVSCVGPAPGNAELTRYILFAVNVRDLHSDETDSEEAR